MRPELGQSRRPLGEPPDRRRSTTRSWRDSGAAGRSRPSSPPGWERSSELAALRRQARELIEADFSGSGLWGFKDPRNSLTLPFWQRILPPMRYVICLRNPVDVAASLKARKEEPVPSRAGGGALVHIRASRARRHRGAPARARLLRGPDGGSRAGGRSAGAFHRTPIVGRRPRRRCASRSASRVSEGLWHHRTAVPNVVDASGSRSTSRRSIWRCASSFRARRASGTEVLDLVGALRGRAPDGGSPSSRPIRTEVEQLRERVARPGARAGRARARFASRSRDLEQRASRARAAARRASRARGGARRRRGPSCGGCRSRSVRRASERRPGDRSGMPSSPPPRTRRLAEVRARAERGDPRGGDRAGRREGRRRAAAARRPPRLALPDGGGRPLPRLSPRRATRP